MSGLLGKDMTPDFNTLSAAGFLETISAVFNNFKPMNNIADKLNVEYLKKLELGNTKNWFEIKNGRVNVKPFNVQVRDISMQIGGSHSLTDEMEYQILTKTPRKTLEKSGLGAVNTGLNFLSKEASKAGVSIAQGEFINVRFDLTGTLFNPKVGMKILGSDGQSTIKEEAGATVQATVDKAKDSLTNVANRELEKAKQKANAVADSLANVAIQKAKEAADKAAQEVKNQVGEKASEKVTEKANEVLGTDGQKKVEDVKKKLNEWDPFKKKKN